MRIPNIFHQIWLGPREMPEKFQIFQRTWIEKNPGWTIKLWNEKNIKEIELLDKNLLSSCKSYAEQSDLIRFFIIRQFGGIYIDTDFECLRGISLLLEDVKCFLAKEKRIDGENITNAIFGATVKNDFIEYVCKILPDRLEKTKKWGKYESCNRIGPYFLEKIYQEYENNMAVTVFPCEYFGPIASMYSTGNRLHVDKDQLKNTYGLHHYASSWISPISRLRRYIWNFPLFGKRTYIFLEKIVKISGIKKWKFFKKDLL